MYDFDFKKYLTEHKLTNNSKLISEIRSGRSQAGYLKVDAQDTKIVQVKRVNLNESLQDFIEQAKEDELDYFDGQTNGKGTAGILYGYKFHTYYINIKDYPVETRRIETLFKDGVEKNNSDILDIIDSVVSDLESD